MKDDNKKKKYWSGIDVRKLIDETLEKTEIKYDHQLNHNTSLNINFWNEDNQLYPEIRKKLLEYVMFLLKNSELNKLKIYDILLVGSIAGYNYTEYSDVDVHILINKDDIGLNDDFVSDYLRSKTKSWNTLYDNKIYTHNVEVYFQDIDDKLFSIGEYSLLKDEWTKQPIDSFIVLNKSNILKKTEKIIDYINQFITLDYKDFMREYTKFVKKLRGYRKSGLEKNDVYSEENIVFKVLRDNNVLSDLNDIKKEKIDQNASLS